MHKSVAKSNKVEHETLPELLRAMPKDAPRFYLITPPISDWTPYPLLFEAAMAVCDVACVLLRIAAHDEDEAEKIVRALAPLVQRHGVACLVADDPQLAVRANADGVHIEGAGERLQSALRALRPGHIVGAGEVPTRHAAMIAAEAGADYLMFGGPSGGEPHASILERVAWWAEIFNVPCAGYAHDLGAIGDLVHAGADFIALGDAVFADPRGAAAALRDAACLMAPTPEAAQ
ncbi:MAG: thiamine phosphate synthase [Pseudomonadota bacterium]|nr:thiamine phosphate synthase [Pseudomonadota bacterium]